MNGIETINQQNRAKAYTKPTTFADITNVFFKSPLARIYSLKSQAVIGWNKERGRIDVPFDVDLEDRLLSEEIDETHDAIATDTVDKILDGYADVLFVAFGTVGKLKNRAIDSDTYYKVKQSLDRVPELRALVVDQLSDNWEFNRDFFDQLELTVLNIVINANNQKGKATHNGKIIKNADFVPPEAEILKAFKRIQEQQAE